MNNIVKSFCSVSRFAIGIILIFTANNVLAYGDKTVKNYVQDGLIAQFDAIANAGWSAEQGDIHNASATTWKDIVSGSGASKSGTGTISIKDTYLSFAGAGAKAYYSIASNPILNALKAKAMTVQIFVRPEAYSDYSGYLTVGGGNDYRQLILDQRDDNTICKNGAIGGLQYRNGSKWPGTASACPSISTSSYINKDILLNIKINPTTGASLSIDDGDVIHTNKGGSTDPTKNTVWLGCAANTASAKMRLYAIRFYNRELTAEEIATNLAIDRERFLGIGVKTTVACSATDSETELSFDGETWQSSIVADDVVNASTVTIKARNSGFERVHFAWSGLPSGATFLDESKSQVQFKNPPEDLEITCKAARLDFSATATDENTELSFDGENWDSTIQLSNVFANSNVTVYARNVSEGDHAYFTWGNLPAGAVMNNTDNSSISFDIPVVESQCSITCSSMASDELNIWTGGTGNFEDAAKWSLGVVPGANSIVILPNKTSAYTVTVNSPLDIGEFIVGGGEGKAYPTVNFCNGVELNKVAGKVTVARGATLTHRINNNKSNQYKLCLKCSTMNIASGASVNGDLKGPFDGATFGSIGTGNLVNQPAYGGVGGHSNNLTSRRCWGSIREPKDLGGAGNSGNNESYKAGGAVYLEVAGELVVNGTISVLSKAGLNYYNGTGGSIYLKVGSISGKGTIDASAGRVTSSSGAGGGRISIRQSVADSFDAFKGSVKAYGCATTKAGCGTIYLEHAGDVYGEGTLLIDSGNITPTSYYCATSMDSLVIDRNEVFGTVIVTNGAHFKLPSGANLRITKRLCTLKGKFSCEEGSKVTFEGPEDAVIEGPNKFYSLSCTTPGKTIRFGEGSGNKTTILSNGNLSLAGEKGNAINLLSKTDDSRWQLSIEPDATVSISYCDVKDSDASSGMMPLDEDGVDLGNNIGWSIMASSKPGDLVEWTGNISTSWTDAGNWNPMMVPNEENCILIPSGRDRYPLIANNTVVNSLTNEAGAAITLSGGDLIVTNAFSSLGTMTFGVNDDLKFEGDGYQKVDLGNNSYSRITVAKSGGSIEFENGFKARHFLSRVTNPLSLAFAAGQTVEVYHLSLFGLVGESGAYDHVLSVGSTGPWNLKVTGPQHLRGVVLSNCDASLGADIKLGALSTDGNGNSLNCDFSPAAAAEWIGGGTGFSTESCWANGIVPQAETQVCICPASGVTWTVNTSSNLATGEIVIGGDGGKVNFTSNYKHDIAGGLYMLSGATCSFGYWASPNEIAGDFLLEKGATLTHGATTSGNKEVYKLNFEVSGDATLEAGSSVNIENKGFGSGAIGPGRTAGGTGGSAFAGLGSQAGNKPYGSILHPFSLGSHGYAAGAHGGGAFRLIADGHVVLDCEIKAGSSVVSYAPGTGGSVWVSGASVKGAGSISVRSTAGDSWAQHSSAGRIAIYQTERIGWSDYGVSISAGGYTGGTYYREDGSGVGELFIDQAYNTSGTVYIPMSNDNLSEYRKVRVIISGGNSITVKNDTWKIGSTLVLRDMVLKASNAKVYLNSSKIKLLSRDHKGGKGWTGGNYEERIAANTIVTGDGGKIVWPEGFQVMIR